jgi:hypothetical protein
MSTNDSKFDVEQRAADVIALCSAALQMLDDAHRHDNTVQAQRLIMMAGDAARDIYTAATS